MEEVKKHKIHIIYSLIILLILCGGLFGYNNQRNKWQDEKIRSEEKIKFYEQDAKDQKHITDSIQGQAKVLEGIIEYQKNNPKIIIEKYNDIRGSVKSLNADQSILYISDKLSKESSHR